MLSRLWKKLLGPSKKDIIASFESRMDKMETSHLQEMSRLVEDLAIKYDEEDNPISGIDEFGIERTLDEPFALRIMESNKDGKKEEAKCFVLDLSTFRLIEANSLSSELRKDNKGWIEVSIDKRKQFEWAWDKQREMIIRSQDAGQRGTGKSVKENTTNFCLGDGAVVGYLDPEETDEAWNKLVSERVRSFWRNNSMHQDQFDVSDRIVDRGEVFVKAHIDENEFLRLEFIDPIEITDFWRNARTKEVTKFQRAYALKGDAGTEIIPVEGMQPDRKKPKEEQEHYLFFHWKFNVSMNIARGRSDLYAGLFWLKIYKDFLQQRSRLNRFRSSVAWHKKVPEKSAGVKASRTKIAKPWPSGVVLITDLETEYTALDANIKAGDVKDDADQFREAIAGTYQIPVFWLFGTGERSNRATAQAMGRVPRRKFKRRQGSLVGIFRDLCYADLVFAFTGKTDANKKESFKTKDGKIIRRDFIIVQLPPIDSETAEDLERRSRAAINLKAAGVGSERMLYEVAGQDYERDIAYKRKEEEKKREEEDERLANAIDGNNEEIEDEKDKEEEITIGPRGGVRIKEK